jgi:cysteine synthase A
MGFGRRQANEHSIRECLESLSNLIGDTPLIEIHATHKGRELTVYAKHEAVSFTGSIKDRMALHVMERAYERGEVERGSVIVEASSGNTGIAFAGLGRALGHPVRIYMPDWMSRERTLLIGGLGAEVVPVTREQGGFVGSVQQAEAFAEEHPGAFLPRQFESDANVEAHYRTTGPELLEQMRALGREPAAFVAGVGTGGTVMGAGAYLREQVPGIGIHPLEPANSPTLRTGHRVGSHRIQGVSDEFVPAIVDLDQLDEIIDVWDGDAILMAQLLASHLGLAVGISSGANFLGCVRLAAELGDGAVVATVFPDDSRKYLSTDLVGYEETREDYLTPEVEFLGVRVLPRAGRSTAVTR